MRLRRLPRDDEDQPRYLHPHGYIIERQRRTWSERGREPGRYHDPPPPLYWWMVYHHIARRRSMLEGRPLAFLCLFSERERPIEFPALRDARAWCDGHPREGWLVDGNAVPR